MLFMEAIKAATENKFVSRTAWDSTGDYLSALPGMPYIWIIKTQPQPNAGNFLPLVADMLADDWKIVDAVAPAGNPATPVQSDQPSAAPTA